MDSENNQKITSGDLWILLVLKIYNPLVQMISLCYFQIVLWYKLIVCCVSLHRVLYRFKIRSSR